MEKGIEKGNGKGRGELTFGDDEAVRSGALLEHGAHEEDEGREQPDRLLDAAMQNRHFFQSLRTHARAARESNGKDGYVRDVQ